MPVPQGLWLTGTAGDFASVPDNAALDITADLTLIAEVGMQVTPPVGRNALVSKWTVAGNQRAYYLAAVDDGSGVMVAELGWSTDGTAELLAQSTEAIPVEGGTSERIRIEAQIDVNNGAGGYTVTFFYYEGAVQTPLGVPVIVAGTTSIFASTANVNIGASEGGTLDLWAGRVYDVEINDGTDQLASNFTAQTLEAAAFTEDSANAFTVTVNQAGVAPNTAEIREVSDFYGWRMPTDQSSTDIWGEPLNEDLGDAPGALFESIDTVIDNQDTEVTAVEDSITSIDDRVSAVETLFNRPRYARVSRSLSSFALPFGATTVVEWDTEHFDQTDWFDFSTNPTRLTKSVIDPDAPGDGLHRIRTVVRLLHHIGDSPDDGYQYVVRILKNGSPIASASIPTINTGAVEGEVFTQFMGSGHTTAMVETLVSVGLNDFFEVDIAVDGDTGDPTTSAVVAGDFDSYFEIVRVPSDSTPGIPNGLLTGLIYWYEARLQAVFNGAIDEDELLIINDQDGGTFDVTSSVPSPDLIKFEANSHASFNGEPVFLATSIARGVYDLAAGLPSPSFISILFLERPSTASNDQRNRFDSVWSGALNARVTNDSIGPDQHEIDFKIRANGFNATLLSSTTSPGLYDGSAHAVLCTYDGTNMNIFFDDMLVANNTVLHGGLGAIDGTLTDIRLWHRNPAAAFFEGEFALSCAWDHALDGTERAALAAFLLSTYNIS